MTQKTPTSKLEEWFQVAVANTGYVISIIVLAVVLLPICLVARMLFECTGGMRSRG